MSLELMYFYGNEAEQYSFYRIPKIMLTDRCYKGVSMEAKVLYRLMLDRMGLSVKNGWMDEDGRVYIYFTLENAMQMMDCGHNKAVKLFADLDNIGLIERKKQGQGRPTRIYVKNFILPPSADAKSETIPSQFPEGGQTSVLGMSACPPPQEVLTSEKGKSALPEGGSLDFPKTTANKTRPLAKLGKAVKIANASNQRKAKGKPVSAVTIAFREDAKPFDKSDSVFNKDTLP